MDCRKCKVPMVLVMTTIEGTAGDTRVKVSGYPYHACERCGAHAYARADFNMHMLESVMKVVPIADRGWLGRESSCSKCHADLKDGAATLETIEATSEVRGPYTLLLEVQAPGFVCPSCGTRQLKGGLQILSSNIADSLIAAFKSLDPIYSWKAS